MSAFHYKANKIYEDEGLVQYQLLRDFYSNEDNPDLVILDKPNLEILNLDDLHKAYEGEANMKPVNWLRWKLRQVKQGELPDEVQHVA